jgi:hypothetical protein
LTNEPLVLTAVVEVASEVSVILKSWGLL